MKIFSSLIIRWLPTLLWMGLIFVLSSFSVLPGPTVIYWDFVIKKSAHMFVFGVLFILFSRSLNFDKPASQRRYLLAFIFTLLYAISDELHQSTTPGRHPQITDVGYDILGGYIAYIYLIGLLVPQGLLSKKMSFISR